MTRAQSTPVRAWVATAAGLSQVAATRAGMLPWWGLPLTIVLTIVAARQHGSVDPQRARVVRICALAGVGAFVALTAVSAIANGGHEANPRGTMHQLTEALILLSLVMAPSWRTPRDYRVWLSVVAGVLVAATVGAQSAFTDVLLVVSWVLVLVALAMIQRAALSAPPTVEPFAATAPAGRLAAVTPVLASLAAGLMVFLVLPAGLGGGDLAAHLVPPDPGATTLLSGRSVVGVDTTGSGTLSLLVRGALPTTPLLRVPLASPALWRGSIYPIYTGDSWEAARSQRYAFAAGNDVSVPTSATDPVPAGTTRTDRVEYASGVHGPLLWAPGVPLQVLGVGGTIHGVLRGPAGVRIAGAQDISGYQVESAVATTSPGRLSAATGPDRISAVWTALPAELPASVGQLARQIVAGTTTRYEEVAAIESYLRRNETYSLNSPVPGPGQDAVADFLFRDHTGFCEQFASAAAVMLRTLGVPARVVSGLAYGTRDGSQRLFTAADAHAWIEVYYPGIGWSPSDPTAGATLATTSRSWRSPVAAAVRRIEADIPGGRAGLAVVALAGLLAVAAAARVVRGTAGRRRRGPAAPIANRPVLAAFHRFAGRRGTPTGRAPAETAREFLERLDPPRPLDAALTTLERECYGTHPPDAEQTLEAVAAFDAQRLR